MYEPRTGRVGESYCRMLCAQAGLIVNAAVEDETGWDFHVEFPDGVLESPLSVDTLHLGAPQCRIQVKTSDNAKRHDDVSLTNLRRMATDPVPAFFLFLELDLKGKVVCSYLVHVNSELITLILKRVHEYNISEPEEVRLNTKTMRVHAGKEDALVANDPEAFREALVEKIGSFDDYRRDKLAHLERTGFEDGRAILELTVGEQGRDTSITDVMLGRAERICLDSFSATLTRFGIPEPAPYIREEGVWLDFPNLQPEPAKLVFRTSPLAAPLSVDVHVFRTFFDDDVDAVHHRIRVAGTFFEHEIEPLVSGFYPMQFSLARPMPLADLDKAIKLMTRLSEDTSSATATLVTRHGASEMTIGLGAVTPIQLPIGSQEVVEKAVGIVRYFGSPPTGAVLYGELLEHRVALSQLESVLSDLPQSFRVMLDAEDTSKYNRDNDIAVVAPVPAPLGQSLYIALILISGEVQATDQETLIIYSSTARVCRMLVLDRTHIDWAELRKEMNSVAESCGDACDVFILTKGFPE